MKFPIDVTERLFRGRQISRGDLTYVFDALTPEDLVRALNLRASALTDGVRDHARQMGFLDGLRRAKVVSEETMNARSYAICLAIQAEIDKGGG